MTINCRGKLIDLSTPKVMGILNVTPDSFFDGGRYKDESSILNSDRYQQCYSQHQSLEAADTAGFNAAMTTCIQDTINTASAEELENVASSMELRSFDFEKTKIA